MIELQSPRGCGVRYILTLVNRILMEWIRETQWRIWSTDLCGWDEDEIRRHRTNRQFRSNPVSTCACTEASRRPCWTSYHSPIAHRWSPSQLEHTAPRCAVMTPPLVCARICLPIYPQNWKKMTISPKLVSDIYANVKINHKYPMRHWDY